jgi:hypothetical protein
MNKLLLIFVSALGLMAADVAGEWKATAEGPNGAMERTLSLKVDGTKLTGETVSSFIGKSVIENGKVDGDTITFTIKAKIQDNEMTISYKGKVTGKDTMTLNSEVGGGGGNAIQWTATRVK